MDFNLYKYGFQRIAFFFGLSSRPDSYHPQLVRWSYNEVPSIVPAISFVNWMSRVSHFYAAENATRIQGFFTGDLRGQIESPNGAIASISYSTNGVGDYKGALIDKFYSLSVSGGVEDPENEVLGGLRYVRNLPVYRASQFIYVWLRLLTVMVVRQRLLLYWLTG